MLNIPGLSAENIKEKFLTLPSISGDHCLISMGEEGWRFRLHSYITYFGDRFWCMWSQGVEYEDGRNQYVAYSTSLDGERWEAPTALTFPKRESRSIARGFWNRGDHLLALYSEDKIGEYFGDPQLYFVRILPGKGQPEGGYCRKIWEAISNYPPKRMPLGGWGMVLRDGDRDMTFFDVTSSVRYPLSQYRVDSWCLDEPDWYSIYPDILVCLFRDNNKSGRLIRSISLNQGKLWSRPMVTDFPNATSKFQCTQLSRGDYVLINNPYPGSKNFCIFLSPDGRGFTKVFKLEIPEIEVGRSSAREKFQYPCMFEQDNFLYISFSRRKQTVEMVMIDLGDLG